MRKFLAIMTVMAAGALTLVSTTACDANLDIGNGEDTMRVMPPIYCHINPDAWDEMWIDGKFEYIYGDIPMPEITPGILESGMFVSYYEYMDGDTPVQEDGGTVRVWDSDGSRRTCVLKFEYSDHNMRITLRPNNGIRFIPYDRMDFRTVILY